MQSPVPAEALADHPGGLGRECPLAGGADPRTSAGAGTARHWLVIQPKSILVKREDEDENQFEAGPELSLRTGPVHRYAAYVCAGGNADRRICYSGL